MAPYLRKHKYEGVGSIESEMGVVVFNPSRLLVEGIFQLAPPATGGVEECGKDCLQTLDAARLASRAAESLSSAIQELADLRETLDRGAPGVSRSETQYHRDTLTGYRHEIPRWQNCLRAFCKRHDIPLTASAIEAALVSAISGDHAS